MPSLASVVWITLFLYLPVETISEGLPVLVELCRHDRHLCRAKRTWIAGLPQPTHTAQLGDPCTEPGDCRIPNSQCTPTDNLYWNRQNFCVCQPGFHPSTGFCVADTGSEGQTPNGLVKLDYTNQQPIAATESSSTARNEDTIKNTSSRSIFVTAAPAQNLLQGFHFGNRTQAIVSNIVEQLTHLRGPQQTDKLKQRLETLGIVQPASSSNSAEDTLETVTTTMATSGTESSSYADASTQPSVVTSRKTITSTIGPSTPPRGSSPTIATSTNFPVATMAATTPGSFESLFPVPDNSQVMAPRWNSPSSAPPEPPGPGVTPTMATVATLKSSSNNSPFLPPDLPPFLTKAHTPKTTSTSTTTTTMMAFNITTTTMPTSPSVNGPEARLALLKKVQNLIEGTTPEVQPEVYLDQTAAPPPPAVKFHPIAPVSGPGNVVSPSPVPVSPSPPPAANNEPVPAPAQPGVPPMVLPAGNKLPKQIHHAPTPPIVKHAMNGFSMPKMPPIHLAGIPVSPPSVHAVTPPSLSSDPDPESQNQARSTLVDHMPSVDFYQVFRSAAENVIREYLGGVLTTTANSIPFPQVPQPSGNIGRGNEFTAVTSSGNIDKMIQKFVESKTGPQPNPAAGLGDLIPKRPPGPRPAGIPNIPGLNIGLGHSPSATPMIVPTRTTPTPTTPRPPTTTTAPKPATATAMTPPMTTGQRHAFVGRTTSPGQTPARPLPRIVFTGR